MARIEKIKINFPINSLNLLIKYLIRKVKWDFGQDNDEPADGTQHDTWAQNIMDGRISDRGFVYINYDKNKNIRDNDILSTYGLIIFDSIKEKSHLLKSNNITRFFWNYYHPKSTTSFHIDSESSTNMSIIFNPHTNSGGTEFILDGKTEFIKSVQNEAIIFPSSIEHRGIAPKTETSRFSLNIIVE